MQAFFGLTPEYKLSIHDTIFAMVTYGKGGWTFTDVYNLPVFLRMYYMKKLTETIDREAAAASGKSSSPKSVDRPNIQR